MEYLWKSDASGITLFVLGSQGGCKGGGGHQDDNGQGALGGQGGGPPPTGKMVPPSQ